MNYSTNKIDIAKVELYRLTELKDVNDFTSEIWISPTNYFRIRKIWWFCSQKTARKFKKYFLVKVGKEETSKIIQTITLHNKRFIWEQKDE